MGTDGAKQLVKTYTEVCSKLPVKLLNKGALSLKTDLNIFLSV